MAPNILRLLIENIQPAGGRRGWHGGPTPLGALRGVTVEQASWRPGKGRKNIWDLALHIAYWNYAVRRKLEGSDDTSREARFGRSPSNWPRPPQPGGDARAWAADITLLRQEHERLVAAAAGVSPAQLDRRPPGTGIWTYGELLVGIAQHDAYHTGQIQLLKRLWAARAKP